MATLSWDSNSWLLRAKVPSGETVFTWTYPMFQDWSDELITPSRYAFMTGYIQERTTPADLELMAQGLYHHAAMASAAVDAWNELPEEDRFDWHSQTIDQIECQRVQAQEREETAMAWIVSDDEAFERDYACIAKDMCDLVRDLIRGYTAKRRLCERMMIEETGMDYY
jgi:hypothetical protein